VESIVISIIAMLSSPNDESPANVDAAKQWREVRLSLRWLVGVRLAYHTLLTLLLASIP
jgi:ubiquitin-protein ligase